MAGWLVGWLAGWLVGWLAGYFAAGWLTGFDKQEQPKIKHVGFAPGIGNFHKKNRIGFDNAYSSNNKLYIEGDTAYIAATDNWKDVFNGWVKIPLSLTRYSQRYQDADDLLKSNPQVKQLTGNSLGGVVSLELQKSHPGREFSVTTYAAPVIQMNDQKHMCFRKSGDVVSAFDSGAVTIGEGSFNPLEAHNYMGYD